jgi:fatty-acyl-CoA synthase
VTTRRDGGEATVMSGVDWWPRRWAIIQSGRPAVTCDGVTVSWGELDRRIDSAAEALADLGVSRGDRIGCLMPNCVEFVVALHAAARLGAVFVPINVRYTASELRRAVDHVGVRVLTADDGFAELVSASGIDVVTVWRSAWPSASAPPRADAGARWDDDGYLLFTSGSTGTPRAVLHSRGAFMWAAMDTVLIHRFNRDDVMVSPLPMCFTGGLNVATALAQCGGHLVLMPAFDAGDALELIGSYRGTVFHGVPLMCQRMADDPGWQSADLSSLRLGRTGAAPVSSGLMQAWLRRGVPLTQGYGCTESAGSGFTLPAEDADRFGKCGRPSFYADVSLVSPATGEPVAPGEVGEIVLRGPQIMRGYWREPEATGEAIRADGLHTGDLAFVDEDGFYEVVGRSKDLIITGGLNVFPAEVEHVVRAAPGVLDAAVVGVPSERWGEQVVAVVVAAAGLDVEAVLAYCRAELADYKCPKSVVVQDGPLNRTASGKIVKAGVRERALAALGGS